MKDPVWLYQKLRPFLRVWTCSYSWEHDVYQRWMGLHPWPAPGPCRSYKVIKWSPEDTAPARCNWGERPTFKEFCKWYGLDPGKGLV